MYRVFIIVVMVFVSAVCWAENKSVDFKNIVQDKIVRVLNFVQGDLNTLQDCKNDLSEKAWLDFMKTLNNYLDPKGATTYNATFIPSGNVELFGENNDVMYFIVPGELIHVHRNSLGKPFKTEYKGVEVDVVFNRKSFKIERIKQRMCLKQRCSRSSNRFKE